MVLKNKEQLEKFRKFFSIIKIPRKSHQLYCKQVCLSITWSAMSWWRIRLKLVILLWTSMFGSRARITILVLENWTNYLTGQITSWHFTSRPFILMQDTATGELGLGLGSEQVFVLGSLLGSGLSEKVTWDKMLWGEKSHTRLPSCSRSSFSEEYQHERIRQFLHRW